MLNEKSILEKLTGFMLLSLSAVFFMTASQQSVADVPDSIKKDLKDINFSREKDLEALAQTYPFLNDDLQKVRDRDMGANISSPPPLIRISEMRDMKGKKNLFFMALNGPDFCGSHGCPMYVYVDDGTGFKKALEILTFESAMHVSRAEDNVALFIDTKKSYTVWSLENGKFVHNVFDAPEFRRDEQRRPIDENGRLIDEYGRPFKLDSRGRPIDENGRLIKYDKDGRPLGASGKPLADPSAFKKLYEEHKRKFREQDDNGRHLGQDKEHDNESDHSRMHGDENHDESDNSQKDE